MIYKIFLIFVILLLPIYSGSFYFFVPSFHLNDFGFESKVNLSTQITSLKPKSIVVNLAKSEVHSKPSQVLFVGDVLLSRNVEHLMTVNGSYYPYNGLNFDSFAHNPFVVGNFEAAIPSKHMPTKPFNLSFSVDEKFLPSAAEAGFTHFSLANNHANDFGVKDYANTLSVLSKDFIASGKPDDFSEKSVTLLKTSGHVLAIINLHATTKNPTDKNISSVMKYANERSDMQILYVHWGIEYDGTSSKPQQSLARKFIERGADLVIGHHPHVVQEVGLVDNVPVFYSLGNYIFDQYFSDEVMEGLVLMLDLDNQPSISLIPTESKSVYSQPRILDPEAHAEFLVNLAEKSHPLLKENILGGRIPLQKIVATSSKIAMIDSINSFNFYVQ